MAKQAAKAEVVTNSDTFKTDAGRTNSIDELWKPAGQNVAFFDAAGISKDSLQPLHQLKSTLEGYIAKHNLINPTERRLIRLDDLLGIAVRGKDPSPPEMLSREEILNRLRAGVAWSVSVDGVVRKGALQPVNISVKTRQGRKTVTLISGLETFGIKVDDLADELKHLCAGSASVQPLQGSSPKLNLKEVMVQGSQTKTVVDLLVDKGVPKRFIKDAGGDKKGK